MRVAASPVVVKRLGVVAYEPTARAMREFTARRGPETPDEIWVLEHRPVYTLGVGADRSHGPRGASTIPVVRCERGGEITYHGPGQAVLYTLVDLVRRGLKVRAFVSLLEQAVTELLAQGGVVAETRRGAPGVYVAGAKIAALGLRVTRGRAYHGLAVNVDMDLAPFAAIDPCGFPGLAVTQTRDLGIAGSAEAIALRLARILIEGLEHA